MTLKLVPLHYSWCFYNKVGVQGLFMD